jgi:hypothetical protein
VSTDTACGGLEDASLLLKIPVLSGSELTSNRSGLDDHRSGWPVEARGVRAASSRKQVSGGLSSSSWIHLASIFLFYVYTRIYGS